MRKLGLLAIVLLLAVACGDDGPAYPPGPYDAIDPLSTIDVPGLSAPVDVVRDTFGVPHIYARTIEDAAFANGYIMPSDRLPQMDLFRHAASGTLSELFGAADRDQIDGDIRMRMHRMRPVAAEAWAELQASTDPIDQEIVRYLTRFSDGVNQYLEELVAGRYTLDPAIEVFFDPARTAAWEPVDSLTIGRLQTWVLSYTDFDLRITDAYQRGRSVFDPAAGDPALARRAGAQYDLIQVTPLDPTSVIDGFPNVTQDTGSRAKPAALPGTVRPWVSADVLGAAQRTLHGPGGLPWLQQAALPSASNNWVVGPGLAGGKTLLANDPHLSLVNPSLWYLIHLTVPGALDVEGATFPGLPAVQLGHNAHLAWGATVVVHDVSDFYLEEIVPCSDGGGDCALRDGQELAIETIQETIGIGALGTVVDEQVVTYEVVPGHGPIIPTIQDHEIIPRAGSEAISVKYTGYEVTHEVRAMYLMTKATTVEEGFAALEHWGHGAMNWVLVDDEGTIGWTSMARVPWRSPGCFTFHPDTNPDGVAPYMVVPGDGSCEWEGWMDARYIPHVINPAQGYIATANADPVGETFDGDALNGPVVDGRPLYAAALYDPGYRAGRITRRLEALRDGGAPMTLDDMADLQADTYSNFGAEMQPHIVAAGAAFAEELASPGTHPDLEVWVAALPADRRTRLQDALARLTAWSAATPAAVEGTPSAAEITDSSATSLFNIWIVLFQQAVLGDELARVGEWPEDDMTPRALKAIYVRPNELRSGIAPETGEPVLCDDLDTATEVESCTLLVLVALDASLTWGAGAEGFGTADLDEWRWGKKHTLTLEPSVPDGTLELPPPNDPNPLLGSGYPRPGDQYAVDRCDPGYTGLSMSYAHGPSMRHLVELTPGEPPRALMALPGGVTYDTRSPHYRDLMDTYWWRNEYFEMPWSTAEIIMQAEARWHLRPAN